MIHLWLMMITQGNTLTLQKSNYIFYFQRQFVPFIVLFIFCVTTYQNADSVPLFCWHLNQHNSRLWSCREPPPAAAATPWLWALPPLIHHGDGRFGWVKGQASKYMAITLWGRWWRIGRPLAIDGVCQKGIGRRKKEKPKSRDKL
jgi:hypothetical protein